MIPLTRVYDPLLVSRLQHALDAAGIESEMTSEVENAYIGRMQFVLWIPEDADPEAVRRACESAAAPRPADPNPHRTTVSPADGTKCRACNYELRGQIQDGRCPECGQPYRLLEEKHCPTCGEVVPGDFDVCWNCSAALKEESD